MVNGEKELKKLQMLPNIVILDELHTFCESCLNDVKESFMKDFDNARILFMKAMENEYSFTRSKFV